MIANARLSNCFDVKRVLIVRQAVAAQVQAEYAAREIGESHQVLSVFADINPVVIESIFLSRNLPLQGAAGHTR
jgi:hypothetical protein